MSESVVSSLKKEASRIEEDCIYSSKGHFEASRRWERIYYWIGVPNTILAAIAGVSIISKMEIVGGILAGLVSLVSGISTFLNPMDKSSNHLVAGNCFSQIKNRVRIFREVDIALFPDLNKAASALSDLASLRDETNKNSPQIPRWAFEAARKGITEGESTYKVDKTKWKH